MDWPDPIEVKRSNILSAIRNKTGGTCNLPNPSNLQDAILPVNVRGTSESDRTWGCCSKRGPNQVVIPLTSR